ncbi:lipoprotein localization protein LolB [Vibrio sp. SCSIO 43140]|uniref:lipoprotein insertase outer membrane protein LolB n=1 Tax=Vibrio sp. SCSIO 43140 TaxID=2819100 RepID=UPI002075162F|nr:lipoprotein insertase outer membrane protein LolB [Vibrio sp. SCSIO 43140]USD61155.1 lipoprotein localization protein LolB [Vibrio sp. SCSIO 43140]
MTRLYRRLFYTFTALFLIGCSTLPPEPQSVEWQAHRQQLESLTQYTANGKLGYISPEQRQTLNFHWTYSANLTQVRLTTFLGQTVFNLTSTPNGAFIETYDDQKLSGQDANLLIYQLTGLNIPIEQLAGWLIGLPTNADTYQLNDLNTVASLSKELNQKTWALNYTEYRAFNVEDTERTLPMPTRMQLVQDDTKLNLVVSKWTIKQ